MAFHLDVSTSELSSEYKVSMLKSWARFQLSTSLQLLFSFQCKRNLTQKWRMKQQKGS